ncbi:MAG: glycosyl hydrolase family 28-related protein [Candidatus Saccharibacteria bacterium]
MMDKKVCYGLLAMIIGSFLCTAQEKPGAAISWITLEAESMKTNGTVMGPAYEPYRVETESSGQRCVKLEGKGQWVEFAVPAKANSMVIRISVPDNNQGKGMQTTLGIYQNGKQVSRQAASSRYTMLYGKYPFTNDPKAEKPRNFYDEIRLTGLNLSQGDVIRIQRDDRKGDDAGYCIIDLVDLEEIPAPVKAPDNSLSITDKAFKESNTGNDYTEAFKKCIARAAETGKSVWIPEGTYQVSGDIVLPSNTVIQGAGMWYSTLMGNDEAYRDAGKRVRLKGNGSNIHLSDFALVGKLNYRNDNEPNDGIVGSFGKNSTISSIWVEHTKVGMWVENSSNLVVEDCRLRNTIADGINFCVGMRQSTMRDCTARGTGDDCFAMWPATFLKQEYTPGHNLITHCTGQLPFLANGAAIYGGESNQVKDCLFTDITPGSAILISTTFPTENKERGINNNFSGTTLIDNCLIRTSGGFDHTWDWRAAVQVCLDRRDISGLELNNLRIENSLSDGISIIANNENGQTGSLSKAVGKNITITTFGIGTKGKHGCWIQDQAHGSLTLVNSSISEQKNESVNFTLSVK